MVAISEMLQEQLRY